MTRPIGPVMDSREWALWEREVQDVRAGVPLHTTESFALTAKDAPLPEIIAKANSLLSAINPRKITHRTVATLRDAARVLELNGEAYVDLLAIADALASYLQPDPEEPPVFPRLDADLQRKLDAQL